MFGKTMHTGMEAYYKSLQKSDHTGEAVFAGKEAFKRDLESYREVYILGQQFDDDLHRGQRLIEDYGIHYYNDHFKVVAVEETMELPLSDNSIFTGRLDLAVVSQEARLYIVDHKFTGWSLSSFAKSIKVSDQGTGYLLLWNSTHPKEMQASGVMFNICRNYKGATDFLRPIIYKTEKDIEDFRLEIVEDFKEMYSRLSNPNALWPKNTDRCFDYNRPCEYQDLCLGANFQALIGSKFVKTERPIEQDS
jgi:hypothetical protein